MENHVYTVRYNEPHNMPCFSLYGSYESAKREFDKLIASGQYEKVTLCKDLPFRCVPRYEHIMEMWDASFNRKKVSET